MESILKNLYYGNLNPDKTSYLKDPEYRKLNDQVLDILELLKKKYLQKILKLLQIWSNYILKPKP